MPNIAFLPFNVGEPVRPALGRQLSQFLSEAYKVQPEVSTNFVNYLAQVGTQEAPEAALVNFGSRGGKFEIETGLSGVSPAVSMAWRGHGIEFGLLNSGTHIAARRHGRLEGGADPRREGAALG